MALQPDATDSILYGRACANTTRNRFSFRISNQKRGRSDAKLNKGIVGKSEVGH